MVQMQCIYRTKTIYLACNAAVPRVSGLFHRKSHDPHRELPKLRQQHGEEGPVDTRSTGKMKGGLTRMQRLDGLLFVNLLFLVLCLL